MGINQEVDDDESISFVPYDLLRSTSSIPHLEITANLSTTNNTLACPMDSVESLLSTSFLFLFMHPSLKTKKKTSS
jgi:hypothetical protein